ncbi:cytochrome c oxidase subunit 7B2, mitochondrial isoform X1 [Callorhinus ursinus]|uniref:cytochrome c oxidase subunit 7B2, mitochondrial isoform X1 n=1 Tax=Callorhinus ursinus TaxID=34884 RepID=UPI003CD008CD
MKYFKNLHLEFSEENIWASEFLPEVPSMLVVVYQEVLLKVGKKCLQERAGFYSFNIVSGVYFLRSAVKNWVDTSNHHWRQAGTHSQEDRQIERSPTLSASCGKECLDESATLCSKGNICHLRTSTHKLSILLLSLLT